MRLRRAAALAAAAVATGCGSGAPAGAPTTAMSDAPPAKPVPDVARVVCADGETRLLTPTVRPRRDGVHIHVENRGRENLALVLGAVGGDNAPAGTSTIVWPLEPGPLRLGCMGARDDPGDLSGLPPLRIVDPAGLWHARVDASCPRLSTMDLQLAPDAKGDPTPPAEQARRRWADEMEPGDRIDHAGYPAAHDRRMRLVRDGRVLVSATWTRLRGGWIVTEETRCDGRAQADPAPSPEEPVAAPAEPKPAPAPADPDHVVCAHVGGDGQVADDVCVPATLPAAPPGSSGGGGGSPPWPGP